MYIIFQYNSTPSTRFYISTSFQHCLWAPTLRCSSFLELSFVTSFQILLPFIICCYLTASLYSTCEKNPSVSALFLFDVLICFVLRPHPNVLMAYSWLWDKGTLLAVLMGPREAWDQNWVNFMQGKPLTAVLSVQFLDPLLMCNFTQHDTLQIHPYSCKLHGFVFSIS